MRLQYCSVHSTFLQGDLPCAWPDCKEGSPDPVVELEEIRYTRESWKIDDAHEAYFWHKAGLPYAYHLRSAAIHELKVLQGISSPLVWHYTDMSSFKNIVETNELWLTDIEYLNDTTELEHGFSYISERLRVADLSLGAENIAFESQLRDMFLQNLDILKHRDSMPRISVACFAISHDGDELTQWKGYGAGATGVAIGFKRDSSFFWNSRLATLGRVIYSDDWKNDLADRIGRYIGFAARADISQKEKIVPAFGKELWHIYERVLCDLLMEISVFIKDSRFNQEGEVRYVHNRNIQAYDSHSSTDEIVTINENRFRIKNDVIVHYFGSRDLDLHPLLGGPMPLPISEVVIGPKAARDPLTKLGVEEFLRYYNYDEVKVRTSDIPFR